MLPIVQLAAAFLPMIDKIIPDPEAAARAKLEAMRLAQAGEFKELDTLQALGEQQARVNAIEAQQGTYRGGWRPFIGWTCGLGLAYHYLARPLAPWLMRVAGVDAPDLPPIDIDALMALVAAMLGLAGYRTFERKNGRA